jgi:hypothetical protein
MNHLKLPHFITSYSLIQTTTLSLLLTIIDIDVMYGTPIRIIRLVLLVLLLLFRFFSFFNNLTLTIARSGSERDTFRSFAVR